jgi:hypothetical protein
VKHRFRSSLLAVALLLATFVASATSSLSFSGDGYWLSMEIGHDDRPVVASVSFHPPGDAKGVVLRGNFDVDVFDTDRKVLVLDYQGGDPRVEPFTLVVRGDKAILSIHDERIESEFSWFM